MTSSEEVDDRRRRRDVMSERFRIRFDGRLTAYQKSLRSEWRNIGRDPLAAVTLAYLFI